MDSVDGQTHMLGHRTPEIDRAGGCKTLDPRSLGQGADTLQNGPVLSIQGVFDDHVFDA